jgi:hypothetical protein
LRHWVPHPLRKDLFYPYWFPFLALFAYFFHTGPKAVASFGIGWPETLSGGQALQRRARLIIAQIGFMFIKAHNDFI